MQPNVLKSIPVFIVVLISIFSVRIIYSNNLNKNKFSKLNLYKKNKEPIESILKTYNSFQTTLYDDLRLTKILLKSNDTNRAINLLEQSLKKTAAPRVGRKLAKIYVEEGNFKRAEELYNFNTNVEPYRYEARMDLLTLLIKANQYTEARVLCEEIIAFPVKISSKKVTNYKERAQRVLSNYKNTKSKTIEGSLSYTHYFNSKIMNKRLPYKIYLPPLKFITEKLPVIYVNDGNAYIKQGKLPNLLDSLIIAKRIEPVVAIFLQPTDMNNKKKKIRQELFLCNPLFVDFFTKEFIPFLEKKYPISSKKEDRSVLGVSFGGLAAAYLADQSPNTFKNVVMQSPAFHPCPDIYKVYQKKPKKELAIYLSYGTGKDTERQDLPMVKILQKKKYDLTVERIEGGDHSWTVWQPQLETILSHFF